MTAKFSEASGKVATIKDARGKVLMSSDERSLCVIRNHRHSTTVNGVCLPCTLSDKHKPANQRRNTGKGKA